MPLLTAAQLRELRQIIQDSATALAVTTFGVEVTDEELQRLADEGYVRPEDLDNLGLTAFTYGQLVAKLPHLVDMEYEEFVSYVRANPVGMSPAEKRTYEVARERAGVYCVGLGNRYSEELGRIVVDADQELATRLREGIAGAVAESGAQRESRGSLVRRLREMSGQMTRDWHRIASTETHQAAQEGLLEEVTDRHGEGERFAKRPVPDACDACKAAYLDENGNPKIFSAAELRANGVNNVGRKKAEWLPVYGVMHPWCVVPGQVVTTHRGQVPIEEVRIGDLVVTAEGRWRPVRQVFQHFYSGEVVELFTESRAVVQRLVVTPDHLVGSAGWKAAKLIQEGAELLVFSDPEDRPPVSDQVLRFATVFLGFDQAGMPVSAIDLDGDFHILPAQIDKVTPDDGVVRERVSMSPQMSADAVFQRGVRAVRLPAKAFDDFLVGLNPSAACTVSSRGELFALVGAESLVADLHSFAARVLLEPGLLDALGDGAAIHPQLAGYRQYGQVVVEVESQDLVCVEGDSRTSVLVCHPSILPARAAIVNNVRREVYRGMVYNLGVAEDESYLVQGTAVHNCRCELIRVPRGFAFNEDGQMVPEEMIEKASKPLPGQLGLLDRPPQQGPFIGPRGGKWADPQHTEHWEPPSTRGRSGDDRFEGIEVTDVVAAGTPRAFDALGPHEHVECTRCGSRISNVFLTSHGPMGGDCLATLTGDQSTRRLAKELNKNLERYMSRVRRVTKLTVEGPSSVVPKYVLRAQGITDRSAVEEHSGKYRNLDQKAVLFFEAHQARVVSALAAHFAETHEIEFDDQVLRNVSKAAHEWMKEIEKALPVGSVHTWADGRQYKKEAEGKWVPVAAPAGEDYSLDDWRSRERTGVIKVDSSVVREKVDQLLKDQAWNRFGVLAAMLESRDVLLKTTTARGQSIDVRVRLLPHPEVNDPRGVSGQHQLMAAEDDPTDQSHLIQLHVKQRVGLAGGWERDDLAATLRSVLAHELAHAGDPHISERAKEGKPISSASSKGRADYYNRPEEIAARMQQIWRELTDRRAVAAIAEMRKEAEGEGSGWKPGATSHLHISETWNRISDDLTPENRKRILRMAARAWEAIQTGRVDPQFEKADQPRQLSLFIGPRGGKWANPQHTRHWEPPTLADTARGAAALHKPVPAMSTVFVNASGGAEKKRFRESAEHLAANNIGVQIVAHEIPIRKDALETWRKVGLQGLRVMVDSGEAGRYRAQNEAGNAEARAQADPQDEKAQAVAKKLREKADAIQASWSFDRIFDQYDRLAEVMPHGQLQMVAPDKIADPDATARMREQYAPRVRKLQENGVEIIAPIQARDLQGYAEDYIRITEAFGGNVILGIPSAKAEVPMDVVLPFAVSLYTRGKFPKLHFLGLGEPEKLAGRNVQLAAAAYFAGRGIPRERILELAKTPRDAARALRNIKTQDDVLTRESDILGTEMTEWARKEAQGDGGPLDPDSEAWDETEAWPQFFAAHPEEYDLSIRDHENKEHMFRMLVGKLSQSDSQAVGRVQQYNQEHDPVTGQQRPQSEDVASIPERVERFVPLLDKYLQAKEHAGERFAPPARSGFLAMFGEYAKSLFADGDLIKGTFGSHAASIVGIESRNTIGGMGHQSPGRTPGENVIAAQPVTDWPPFKKRKKRKKRKDLPRAAERLDVKGLHAPIGFANPPTYEQVQAESAGVNPSQAVSGQRYRDNLEEQQRSRQRLRRGARLVVPMHPREKRDV